MSLSRVFFCLGAWLFLLSQIAHAEQAGAENSSTSFSAVEVMARSHPFDPSQERFLEKWTFEAFSIDEQANPIGEGYYASSDESGNARIVMPELAADKPMIIRAHNRLLSSAHYEVFVPARCHDQALWLIAPIEDAVWRYYQRAASSEGQAWNPYFVDCTMWLSNMQMLASTDVISDAFRENADRGLIHVSDEQLAHAYDRSPELLIPTRSPICMAERRHSGGDLRKGAVIKSEAFPYLLESRSLLSDSDPVLVGSNGIVTDLCHQKLDGVLHVNNISFAPNKHNLLRDDDFMGVIQSKNELAANLDVTVYNVRHTNGYGLSDKNYDDSCSITTMIEFANKDDDEQYIQDGSGVVFTGFFGIGADRFVSLTSSGDTIVDKSDTWAIFSQARVEKAILVELPGHRQEDYADVLSLDLRGTNGEDLFIGLDASHELNERQVDGEKAYMHFTMTAFDSSGEVARHQLWRDVVNCYEASDPWARQFFNFSKSAELTLSPVKAAEFVARSQCNSNSRSQQRWQSADVGYWSMNNTHGVAGNVIINPGWLPPYRDYEVYIQKFDEAVFKGPRTVAHSDEMGGVMLAIPTLVEGDRVLLKSTNRRNNDHEVVIPCGPDFEGFPVFAGYPYVPISPVPTTPTIPPIPCPPSPPAISMPK